MILLAGAGFWYWQNKPSVPGSLGNNIQMNKEISDISLGSQILQRTQNLLSDKFPETNPLKQIMKNPF